MIRSRLRRTDLHMGLRDRLYTRIKDTPLSLRAAIACAIIKSSNTGDDGMAKLRLVLTS